MKLIEVKTELSRLGGKNSSVPAVETAEMEIEFNL